MTSLMHSPWFTLLVIIGTATRLTRLVVHDKVFAPVRAWAIRICKDPDKPLAMFFRCPWCVGTWAAAFTVAWWEVARHLHNVNGHLVFYIPATVLTVAQAAGMMTAPGSAPARPSVSAEGK